MKSSVSYTLLDGFLARRAVLELERADPRLDLVGRPDNAFKVCCDTCAATRSGSDSKVQLATTERNVIRSFIALTPLVGDRTAHWIA
mgnify:CR=1 FL=1